jgi:hypothetical protein
VWPGGSPPKRQRIQSLRGRRSLTGHDGAGVSRSRRTRLLISASVSPSACPSSALPGAPPALPSTPPLPTASPRKILQACCLLPRQQAGVEGEIQPRNAAISWDGGICLSRREGAGLFGAEASTSQARRCIFSADSRMRMFPEAAEHGGVLALSHPGLPNILELTCWVCLEPSHQPWSRDDPCLSRVVGPIRLRKS